MLQVYILLSVYSEIATGVHTQVTADQKLNDEDNDEEECRVGPDGGGGWRDVTSLMVGPLNLEVSACRRMSPRLAKSNIKRYGVEMTYKEQSEKR